MVIAIDRRGGLPLHVQVERQIERLIQLGAWGAGKKLPTERDLGRALGISRNTVSVAYRELAREGLVSPRRGSGTYVSEKAVVLEDPAVRVGGMLDLALDQAEASGMEVQEVARLLQARVQARRELLMRLLVGFVECNREQLDYFAREVELGSGTSVLPVLLDDLRRDPDGVRTRLAGAGLVVTTLFHLEEVKAFLPGQEVLGIALDPEMETMVRIARLSPGVRVGLVCISADFADRVRKSIANAGMSQLQLLSTTTRDETQLRRFLEGVQAAIASPGRRREVERLAPQGTEVIEFIYRPDAGSINLLRSVLLERRQQAS